MKLQPFACALLLVALLPLGSTASGSPCLSTDYFCDDVDNGPQSEGVSLGPWAQSGGVNQWRTVDESAMPQPLGEGARSLSEYYYVGASVYPGVTYRQEAPGARWVSPAFTIPASAVSPTFGMAVSGGSEEDFDFLHVYVIDTETLVETELTGWDDITGSRTYGTYPDFSAGMTDFIGRTIRLVLLFTTDDFLEDGPGWNVDDIIVS